MLKLSRVYGVAIAALACVATLFSCARTSREDFAEPPIARLEPPQERPGFGVAPMTLEGILLSCESLVPYASPSVQSAVTAAYANRKRYGLELPGDPLFLGNSLWCQIGGPHDQTSLLLQKPSLRDCFVGLVIHDMDLFRDKVAAHLGGWRTIRWALVHGYDLADPTRPPRLTRWENLRLLARLPALEQLAIFSQVKFNPVDLSGVESIQGLEALAIHGGLTLRTLEQVGSLRQLRALSLDEEPIDNELNSQALRYGPNYLRDLVNLEALDIRGLELTDPVLDAIGQLRRLRTLWLTGTHPKVTKDGYSSLAQLRQLVTLHLPDTPNTTATSLQVLGQMPALRYLAFGPQFLSLGQMQRIGACSELRYLGLAYCDLVDSQMAPLAQLHKLEVVNLEAVPIQGPGLAYLEGCPDLRVINLNYKSAGSPEGQALLKRLPRLRYFHQE